MRSSAKTAPLRTQLKAARKAAGLNQKEMAARMEVSQATISLIEHGTRDTTVANATLWAEICNKALVLESLEQSGPEQRLASLIRAGAVDDVAIVDALLRHLIERRDERA